VKVRTLLPLFVSMIECVGCAPPRKTPPKFTVVWLMTRYPDEATTVPETGMIVSLAYPNADAVVYRLRAELSRPGRVSPLPAFSRARRFASLKLNVTGNVKDALEATVLGRDELPHWKVPRLMVQPVIVTAVFAVQVT
jgi:hypothetical protein